MMSNDPTAHGLLTRREMLAALASIAALPLVSACGAARTSPAAAATDADRNAIMLLDRIGNDLLHLFPETATSLGLDVGPRAELRSRLADRSAAGQRRIAEQLRADLGALAAVDAGRLSHAVRTSVEVVRSAYTTALEGFALPYGDITVGGWRNTPYVVIQNVGAYLDVPRFLDSDHRVENAADAEAYLARLQSYARQLDGELERMRAARGVGLVPPAFLLDKALPQIRQSAQGAREGGMLVESLERRSRSIPGSWAERARRIAAQEIAPALDRQIRELEAQRAVATNDAGISARPHGEEFYRWALKASTTTTMSPDEVHELGRNELAQLHARMDAILKEVGYTQGTVGERMNGLANDPRYQFAEGDAGRAEILRFIDDRLAWIRAQMPRAFNTVVNPEHGGEAPAARGGAGRAGRVRRRRVGGRQRSPAASGSTSAPRTCTAGTAWRTWPFTRRSPATSGRASTRTTCRWCARCCRSTRTPRAGRSTPSSWPTSWARTSGIPSAGWATCSRSRSGPAGSSWTPACTPRGGRASRACGSSWR